MTAQYLDFRHRLLPSAAVQSATLLSGGLDLEYGKAEVSLGTLSGHAGWGMPSIFLSDGFGDETDISALVPGGNVAHILMRQNGKKQRVVWQAPEPPAR